MSLQHPDRLIVRTIVTPILNEYFGSANQKADIKDVAEEIKRRYVARVPRETGRLAATARVVMRKSLTMPDGRFDAEFLVGGGGVDYADDVEREHHVLAHVLREMGLIHGDIVNGPTGRIAPKDSGPTQEKSVDEAVAEERASDTADLNAFTDQEERFGRFGSGRRQVSATKDREYDALSRATQRIQARYGDEAARPGYRAMLIYRQQREQAGLPGHPSEHDNKLTYEMIQERIGERGGVTDVMREAGIQSPYDRGESDPLSNYFSAEELQRYGRSGDEE